MLIRDFRWQFYEIVKKKHVLVIVNRDVDALCACKILLYLFDCDHVIYSVVSVDRWSNLEQAIANHSQLQHIIMINCGGNRSLSDIFNMERDVNYYIIDSILPYNLDNIYANERIYILASDDDIQALKCPPANEIFESDDADESDDDEENSDNEDTFERIDSKRRRITERLERRELKRLNRQRWMKHRDDVIWNYYEYNWYGVSTAVRLFELAHELSRSTVELLWCGCVALSSQLIDSLITIDCYMTVCIDRVMPHVKRFSHRSNDPKADVDRLHIQFEKELTLPLYRHWSLLKSMNHDREIACRLRLWTQRGVSHMRHFLADLGLTLSECEQLFSALDSERRKEVIKVLQSQDRADKYKLTGQVFGCFSAHAGYATSFNAADFSRALTVRLEAVEPTEDDNFFSTMEILNKFFGSHHGRRDIRPLLTSVDIYKQFIEMVVREVYVAINANNVLSMGSFLQFCLNQCAADTRLLLCRHGIGLFARFLLSAFIAAGKRFKGRPLIVAIALSGEHTGWYLVAGIMPLNAVENDGLQKSFIGRAFNQVLDRSKIDARRDQFDPSIFMLKAEDRGRFFDGLQVVVETVV